MLIQFVSVNVEDKGKYKMMKVAYRNNGKLSEKTLMPFGDGAVAFDVLSSAKEGDWFDVEAKKNDKGFWDWVKVQNTSAPVATADQPRPTGNTTTPTNRSYETAEERAARQMLIVRQSSISNSLEYFSKDKTRATVQEVLEVADAFVDYVFNKRTYPKDIAGIMEMEDDIPY